MPLAKGLGGLWSATRFADPEVSAYAEQIVMADTRRGLRGMASLMFALHFAAAMFYSWLGYSEAYLYTYTLLALLSVHVMISARYVKDLRGLQVLGMALLVITGLAVILLAHKTGTLSLGVLASVVLLFMAMPVVPWGLRDAILVVVLVYAVLTLSTLSGGGRFDTETLLTLQFVLVAAAGVAIALVARNLHARKDDIRARFDLEASRREMETLSYRDPLTGAVNRRYLDEHFPAILGAYHAAGRPLHFALLDVDDFKQVNDVHGHQFGDRVLVDLVTAFRGALGPEGHVVRLGGDEFACLFDGDSPQATIDHGLGLLRSDPELLAVTGGVPVGVSVGFVTVAPDTACDIDTLYRQADEVMYDIKRQRNLRRRAADGADSTRAGRRHGAAGDD